MLSNSSVATSDLCSDFKISAAEAKLEAIFITVICRFICAITMLESFEKLQH